MSIIQNEHDPLTSVPPSSMTPRAQSHSVNVDHPLATLGKLVRKSSTPPARLENLAFEPRLLWCRGGVPAAGKPGCTVTCEALSGLASPIPCHACSSLLSTYSLNRQENRACSSRLEKMHARVVTLMRDTKKMHVRLAPFPTEYSAVVRYSTWGHVASSVLDTCRMHIAYPQE